MKKLIAVTQYVEIEYDESKFTPEWMEEFREWMCDFYEVDEHLMNLCQLKARGLCDDGYVEGYGVLKEADIRMSVIDQETEICSDYGE